jgi:hypothetical protein
MTGKFVFWTFLGIWLCLGVILSAIEGIKRRLDKLEGLHK